jgi:hypothetical protein
MMRLKSGRGDRSRGEGKEGGGRESLRGRGDDLRVLTKICIVAGSRDGCDVFVRR